MASKIPTLSTKIDDFFVLIDESEKESLTGFNPEIDPCSGTDFSQIKIISVKVDDNTVEVPHQFLIDLARIQNVSRQFFIQGVQIAEGAKPEEIVTALYHILGKNTKILRQVSSVCHQGVFGTLCSIAASSFQNNYKETVEMLPTEMPVYLSSDIRSRIIVERTVPKATIKVEVQGVFKNLIDRNSSDLREIPTHSFLSSVVYELSTEGDCLVTYANPVFKEENSTSN